MSVGSIDEKTAKRLTIRSAAFQHMTTGPMKRDRWGEGKAPTVPPKAKKKK